MICLDVWDTRAEVGGSLFVYVVYLCAVCERVGLCRVWDGVAEMDDICSCR
jgi:hypothetical protein